MDQPIPFPLRELGEKLSGIEYSRRRLFDALEAIEAPEETPPWLEGLQIETEKWEELTGDWEKPPTPFALVDQPSRELKNLESLMNEIKRSEEELVRLLEIHLYVAEVKQGKSIKSIKFDARERIVILHSAQDMCLLRSFDELPPKITGGMIRGAIRLHQTALAKTGMKPGGAFLEPVQGRLKQIVQAYIFSRKITIGTPPLAEPPSPDSPPLPAASPLSIPPPHPLNNLEEKLAWMIQIREALFDLLETHKVQKDRLAQMFQRAPLVLQRRPRKEGQPSALRLLLEDPSLSSATESGETIVPNQFHLLPYNADKVWILQQREGEKVRQARLIPVEERFRKMVEDAFRSRKKWGKIQRSYGRAEGAEIERGNFPRTSNETEFWKVFKKLSKKIQTMEDKFLAKMKLPPRMFSIPVGGKKIDFEKGEKVMVYSPSNLRIVEGKRAGKMRITREMMEEDTEEESVTLAPLTLLQREAFKILLARRES